MLAIGCHHYRSGNQGKIDLNGPRNGWRCLMALSGPIGSLRSSRILTTGKCSPTRPPQLAGSKSIISRDSAITATCDQAGPGRRPIRQRRDARVDEGARARRAGRRGGDQSCMGGGLTSGAAR
jgi:hypothetical protein